MTSIQVDGRSVSLAVLANFLLELKKHSQRRAVYVNLILPRFGQAYAETLVGQLAIDDRVTVSAEPAMPCERQLCLRTYRPGSLPKVASLPTGE